MSGHFTEADVIRHAQKNNVPIIDPQLKAALEQSNGVVASQKPILPQPVQMSRPEREMGMMLEAQKRAAEIVDYRFQGMSLAYGADPETGILLRYKCDYVVIERQIQHVTVEFPLVTLSAIKIIECKGHGKHAISAAAKLRFKGAKAAWPMFKFEMHQRARDGSWRRVL